MSAIEPRRQRRALAKGTFGMDGRACVPCRFDELMFEEIRILAAATNISFAEMVRRLCQKGLEARREITRAA